MNFYNKMFGINLPTADEILAEDAAQRNIILTEMAHNQPESPKHLGAVNFILQEDGTIGINCEWYKENEDCGKLYGDLLYRIGSGALNNTIGHIISQAAVTTVTSKDFVFAALDEWAKLHTNKKENPIIHPMAVFKRSNTIGET